MRKRKTRIDKLFDEWIADYRRARSLSIMNKFDRESHAFVWYRMEILGPCPVKLGNN